MITVLAAKGLHYLMNVVHEWMDQYHVDKTTGDIIFQNKRLYTNVRLSTRAIHEIGKHSTGFENIPKAVTDPDEVWSYWEDQDDQQVVIRNYMLFGSVCYVVQTKDGNIQDAFALTPRTSNKYRRGCIL